MTFKVPWLPCTVRTMMTTNADKAIPCVDRTGRVDKGQWWAARCTAWTAATGPPTPTLIRLTVSPLPHPQTSSPSSPRITVPTNDSRSWMLCQQPASARPRQVIVIVSCFRLICSHLRNFTSVSVSRLSVSVLFICYFISYLGNQLRWASAFLVACHCALYPFLVSFRCVLCTDG